MHNVKKESQYSRLFDQLKALLSRTDDRLARMATVASVLHHKISYFSWTGFYTLRENEMRVGVYQGRVACQVLPRDTGVCWAAYNQGESLVVEDVEHFPGHIACDPRSRSEIVIPLFDREGRKYGVLDVDSTDPASFDEVDRHWLEKVVFLINHPEETGW
ncbi:MAG: histidine kinase [Bacteroidetes bacterium]|nr:MAG: histidine kinase [Bacteroidota bacterium]PIE88190.1 MAG: histidine kinase [Bacteroidota bacterium]